MSKSPYTYYIFTRFSSMEAFKKLYLSDMHQSMNTMGCMQGNGNFAWDPLHSYFDEYQINEIIFTLFQENFLLSLTENDVISNF